MENLKGSFGKGRNYLLENTLGQIIKNLSIQATDIKNKTLKWTWGARNEQGQIVQNGTYFFVVRVGDETKVVKVMFFGA